MQNCFEKVDYFINFYINKIVMKTGISSSIRLNLLMSSLLIVFVSGCSNSAEEMCVDAQMTFYDQAKPNSKQREYFDTAFKSRDAYYAWAWRECVKK